ncbi:winged helix-turn-helix domain-containing protein [Gordonia sp. NPDC003424]
MESNPTRGGTRKKSGKSSGDRDFDALRDRRMRAADMFAAGKRQVEVAAELEVSQQTVSRWFKAWSEGGRDALDGARRAGRKPWLTDEQIAELETELTKGPKANGFVADMWTLDRVGEVIERMFSVHYSRTQTWSILRDRLGWTRQRPARRAVERDEDAIVTWRKKEWPRIKE